MYPSNEKIEKFKTDFAELKEKIDVSLVSPTTFATEINDLAQKMTELATEMNKVSYQKDTQPVVLQSKNIVREIKDIDGAYVCYYKTGKILFVEELFNTGVFLFKMEKYRKELGTLGSNVLELVNFIGLNVDPTKNKPHDAANIKYMSTLINNCEYLIVKNRLVSAFKIILILHGFFDIYCTHFRVKPRFTYYHLSLISRHNALELMDVIFQILRFKAVVRPFRPVVCHHVEEMMIYIVRCPYNNANRKLLRLLYDFSCSEALNVNLKKIISRACEDAYVDFSIFANTPSKSKQELSTMAITQKQ